MSSRLWLGAVIALILTIYAQTSGFAFINYDDESYVTANKAVLNGLTPDSVAWAFSSVSTFYWHPLTWLSLMTSVTLFGPSAGVLHLVNLAFHIGAIALVFLALRDLTGAVYRSLAVAALFGVHPLRVESVAWVAEHKDVLSGFLMAATMWAYSRYARRPGRGRYAVVLCGVALACMAKPAAVVLPALLLLLDYWPLKRRAWLEKVPMFAMAAALAVVTIVGQKETGSLDLAGPLSVGTRIQNAIYSLGLYLWTTFLPSNMALIYPYPRDFPGVLFIALALVAITGLTIWQRRERPWLLTGWVWFVIGVAPTLGLIQAGAQARADRFTYIAHIGLFLALVWLAAEFVPKRALAPLAAAVALVLTFLSWRQTSLWKDSRTILAHTLAVTPENWLAEYKYGMALLADNDKVAAQQHLTRAAASNTRDPYSRYELGRLAGENNRAIEAEQLFGETVRLKPDYAAAHYSRGAMLVALGRPDEALLSFQQAIRAGLTPEWEAGANNMVGVLLANSGSLAEAQKYFREAVRLAPNSMEARQNMLKAQQELERLKVRP